MKLTSPSEIRPLLTRHGFDFSKSLGQNFLINPEIPVKIAAACGAGEQNDVIEIGAGIGCLTAELARGAKRVFALEIDKRLMPVLDETLAEFSNITVINADIMKTDLNALAELYGMEKVRVCANLPYYITTPVIMKLLETVSERLEKITVMIQKEVADRLTAKPGSSEYGAITAAAAYYALTEKHFDVSPACFMPAPKVTSTVISLTPISPPVTADKKTLFRVIGAAFAMRRKTMANNLSAEFSVSKQEAAELLKRTGKDERVRGETLSLAEFAALAAELYGK